MQGWPSSEGGKIENGWDDSAMSDDAAEIIDGIATFRIAGMLDGRAIADLQTRLGATIQKHGKLRVLLRAEDFAGWATGTNWDDLAFQDFQDAFDAYLERVAVVVDARWQTAAVAFLGGELRPFPLKCFAPSELKRARAWLAEV